MEGNTNAILMISCPDQRGLIAKITDFIYKNNGNIEHADQHVDHDQGVFFMRLEWTLDGFQIDKNNIAAEFSPIAEKLNMNWELHFNDNRPKLAIFVSRQLHCLYDLLYRYREGRINADIPVIISNHEYARDLVESFKIDFKLFSIDKDTKTEQEKKELEILKEYNIDTVVLARYMQILTKDFIEGFSNNIINIHHSFLPAFVGYNPYEQAYKRGVKIVGATSHFVTEELDAGPIIEQDVVRISHRDSVEDLKRKGEDLEKLVLSRAVQWYLERKILLYGSDGGAKTVVFN
ncbi:formyltetrahydrofolate deformylase [Elusimicrobiota bacterium]